MNSWDEGIPSEPTDGFRCSPVPTAVARKDYEDPRLRQAQGQAKVEADGKYKVRTDNVVHNDGIAAMLRSGASWSTIRAATGCSRAKVATRADAELAA